jgi:hypothetical protein
MAAEDGLTYCQIFNNFLCLRNTFINFPQFVHHVRSKLSSAFESSKTVTKIISFSKTTELGIAIPLCDSTTKQSSKE